MASLLERRGFAVTAATNGQEALDLLESGLRPQLMLIDLMLPKVSGWDLLDYLRQDEFLRTVPTIIVTGVPSEQVKVIADAVLRKPLDFEHLVRTVDTFVPAG